MLRSAAFATLLLAPLTALADGEPRELHLRRPVQLTFREEFARAGEAYLSPDGSMLIFQAIPAPVPGADSDPFYAMYVAPVLRDRAGAITGLGPSQRISPPGSANTCGWFHPTEPLTVIYGSTLGPPQEEARSGFQVGTRNYVWQFPEEMEIVRQALAPDGSPLDAPKPIFSRRGYDAECSFDNAARLVLYTRVEDRDGRPDADIWLFDSETGEHTPLVQTPGYDGGPFFSPDERSICYRSDRKGDDKLQVFVATLRRENGRVVGIEREYQITDNGAVNFGPYWHPSGRFLIYASSEISHQNYELFAVPIDLDKLAAGLTPDRIERRRITFTPGADVLPVFSPDGSTLIWTSQRGPMIDGESRPSSQVWAAGWIGDPFLSPE